MKNYLVLILVVLAIQFSAFTCECHNECLEVAVPLEESLSQQLQDNCLPVEPLNTRVINEIQQYAIYDQAEYERRLRNPKGELPAIDFNEYVVLVVETVTPNLSTRQSHDLIRNCDGLVYRVVFNNGKPEVITEQISIAVVARKNIGSEQVRFKVFHEGNL